IIPLVRPANFNNLEYELISRIFRLPLPEKPSVALYAPVKQLSPELMQMFMRSGRPIPQPRDNFSFLEEGLRGEDFDVSRIKLVLADTIPEKADCVLIINPKELNERQRYEINRALVEGKNVLLAVQNYTFDYSPVGREMFAIPQEVKPQINELLEHVGLTVDEQFLMDRSRVMLSVPSEQTIGGGFIRMQVSTPVEYPTQILAIDENMNHNVSITNRLDSVLYLWGTVVNVDEDKIKEAGLKHTVLMTSTKRSWTAPFHSTRLTREDVTPPAGKYVGKQPLMVMLSGQFPDAFKGKERPEWPPPKPRYPGEMPPPAPEEEDEPEKPLKPNPGKLIVIGCSQMFTNNFIRSGGNALLASNTVDALALGEELINIRSKSFTDRSIGKTSPGQKLLYRFLSMGLVPLIFIALGIIRYIVIKKGKERYLKSLASA
ncbi:Gldg family protein, partial [bacterium]|nr:Gldg family protein [bacterium]